MDPEVHKPQKPHEKKIKISLKEMPKKYKKSGLTKKKIPQPKIVPPMPKGSQLKKISKPIKFKQPKPPRVPKLNKPKPRHKTKVKTKQKVKSKTRQVPPKKPYIPLLAEKKYERNITKKTKKQNKLAWLYEDDSSSDEQKNKQQIHDGGNISQDIRELYGAEFGKLSPGQQKYILDNQEIMRRITQQVLNRVARVNIPRDLNVNRSNIVEFYLHPNGDISDFKFLSKSGFYVLDDTTKETIEYAYSKYPRPKEKTLIRYNVFYNLARY